MARTAMTRSVPADRTNIYLYGPSAALRSAQGDRLG